MSATECDHYKRTYRPDIDGIRAIAILSVVLYHAGLPWIHGGFTGVDIFFVISGYLIGGHIFYELLTGSFSYLQFYRRRAKRILPAFYVVLGFAILAALILLSPFEAVDFGRTAIAATLSVSNILFGREAGNYFASNNELNPLLMTWSLGVEEQFYAVIPVLMVLLARIRRSFLLPAIVVVCLLSFLYACYDIKSQPQSAFYALSARAWELGIGIALAVAELKKKCSLLPKAFAPWASLTGLALMLCPMAMLTGASPFPGAAAVPSVLGTALVIAAPACWINRYLLSLPPLVFIGRISYSWYLWHWPILSFLRIISGGNLPPVAVALAIATSFGAAIATYYVIEQPFRRSNLPAAPLLFRYAICSFVALAICGTIWISRGIPQRFAQLSKIERENSHARFLLGSDPCIRESDPNLSSVCYDSSDAHPVVALWGDSHVAALAPTLRKIIYAQGYGIAEFSKANCPPLIGVAFYFPKKPSDSATCFPYNHKIVDLINSTNRIKIVILAGFWESPWLKSRNCWIINEFDVNQEHPSIDARRTLFMHSLAKTIQALQAGGKQVIVLDDVPNFKFTPLWIVRTSHIPTRHRMAEWIGVEDVRDTGVALPNSASSAALVTSLLRDTVSAFPRATLVDLSQKLCNDAGQCAYRKDSQLIYVDTDHVTADGARYALRDFHLPSVETLDYRSQPARK